MPFTQQPVHTQFPGCSSEWKNWWGGGEESSCPLGNICVVLHGPNVLSMAALSCSRSVKPASEPQGGRRRKGRLTSLLPSLVSSFHANQKLQSLLLLLPSTLELLCSARELSPYCSEGHMEPCHHLLCAWGLSCPWKEHLMAAERVLWKGLAILGNRV